ncbi:tol-pal system protein YbgF [Pseudodesulfovibrio nedwellii]|uniref:Tol-pal system protein YbgF n=1 Tax=Pseudodesulfovibrio nedwellii TaxID=2973072 RepID=A0ABN6S0T7_9BACT|nr:tol-pal system protein YbgF [Pseudodesulfovibrio nedwellii]BDQ35945.1 tol-pal system protein YbgF [Pseudodesulfovibrio nedwellii]
MKTLKLVLLVLLGLLLVSCATTKKDAATVSASTEWRIKSLEESFLNIREQQRRMADENALAQDKIDQRLASLETEIAGLRTGGVVESPAESTQGSPSDNGWVTDLKPEDDGWVDGQKAPAISKAQSNEDKPWAEVPQPPAVIPAPEVIQRSAAKTPVTSKPVKSPSGAKGLYDAGLSQYNAEQFDASRVTFDQFLKKYPNNDLAANALYWKGETYYSQKDYAQAILTFKEVTGRFPKHHKSASALLKIGMSYDKVGDSDNSIFYLRALVEDFPKSAAATLGRKELVRLGG